MRVEKVGIMGGTFNPIHVGHLILGQAAYEQFDLDKVLFMPTKKPPHKLQEKILSDSIRAEMVQCAIADNPKFELSTIELDRDGITYTADTLTELKSVNKDTQYYFIIGADSLFYIDKWKDPERIFQLSHVVASTRYHLDEEQMRKQIDSLNQLFTADIQLLNAPNVDVSSSDIRERVRNGSSIKYFVTKEVETYIRLNKCYIDE